MSGRKTISSCVPAELAESMSDIPRHEFSFEQIKSAKREIAYKIIFHGGWNGHAFDEYIDLYVNEGYLPVLSIHLLKIAKGADMLDSAWELQKEIHDYIASKISDEMAEAELIGED